MEQIDLSDLSNNDLSNNPVKKIDGRKMRTKENRTQKQIDAWQRAIEARAIKRLERKQQRERVEEIVNKEFEDIVLKKAISIKKRQVKSLQQIKMMSQLEKIEDDNTPIEEIKEIIQSHPSGQHKKEINVKKIFTFI